MFCRGSESSALIRITVTHQPSLHSLVTRRVGTRKAKSGRRSEVSHSRPSRHKWRKLCRMAGWPFTIISSVSFSPFPKIPISHLSMVYYGFRSSQACCSAVRCIIINQLFGKSEHEHHSETVLTSSIPLTLMCRLLHLKTKDTYSDFSSGSNSFVIAKHVDRSHLYCGPHRYLAGLVTQLNDHSERMGLRRQHVTTSVSNRRSKALNYRHVFSIDPEFL